MPQSQPSNTHISDNVLQITLYQILEDCTLHNRIRQFCFTTLMWWGGLCPLITWNAMLVGA